MEEIDHVAKLKYIEVANFKSFKDVQRIGPFERNFVAVIGCNGAGNNIIAVLVLEFREFAVPSCIVLSSHNTVCSCRRACN